MGLPLPSPTRFKLLLPLRRTAGSPVATRALQWGSLRLAWVFGRFGVAWGRPSFEIFYEILLTDLSIRFHELFVIGPENSFEPSDKAVSAILLTIL